MFTVPAGIVALHYSGKKKRREYFAFKVILAPVKKCARLDIIKHHSIVPTYLLSFE